MRSTMKKVMAVGVALLCFAACGKMGKAQDDNAMADADSVAVDTLKADSTHIEKEAFTVTFPPGWVMVTEGERLVEMKVPDPANNAPWAVKASFRLETLPGAFRTAAAYVAEKLRLDDSATALDDVTANGITWKVMAFNAMDKPIMMYAPLPVPGVAKVYMENVSLDDPDVKAILESITLRMPPPDTLSVDMQQGDTIVMGKEVGR